MTEVRDSERLQPQGDNGPSGCFQQGLTGKEKKKELKFVALLMDGVSAQLFNLISQNALRNLRLPEPRHRF